MNEKAWSLDEEQREYIKHPHEFEQFIQSSITSLLDSIEKETGINLDKFK